MKLLRIIFAMFGVAAFVAVVCGAYWHVYTLVVCVFVVWVARPSKNKKK